MYSADDQREFWNRWNVRREAGIGRVSRDQRKVILQWLDRLQKRGLDIIEVGCGAGWLCADLTKYGSVVGTDLSDEVLARAAERVPDVTFIAGDFLELDFGDRRFDVVVTLETLTHVPDQAGFIRKCAALLRPGGVLMLATQNKVALEKNRVQPLEPGGYRRWLDRHELTAMLQTQFEIEEIFSLTPKFNRGVLKLVNFEPFYRVAGVRLMIRPIARLQEKAWLGWTLMALARKRA